VDSENKDKPPEKITKRQEKQLQELEKQQWEEFLRHIFDPKS